MHGKDINDVMVMLPLHLGRFCTAIMADVPSFDLIEFLTFVSAGVVIHNTAGLQPQSILSVFDKNV